MATTQVFRVRDYEMMCGAKAVDNGRFEPTLVVAKNLWPSRPRTIAMRRDVFPTEQDAIESAHAQGLEWIANFG